MTRRALWLGVASFLVTAMLLAYGRAVALAAPRVGL